MRAGTRAPSRLAPGAPGVGSGARDARSTQGGRGRAGAGHREVSCGPSAARAPGAAGRPRRTRRRAGVPPAPDCLRTSAIRGTGGRDALALPAPRRPSNHPHCRPLSSPRPWLRCKDRRRRSSSRHLCQPLFRSLRNPTQELRPPCSRTSRRSRPRAKPTRTVGSLVPRCAHQHLLMGARRRYWPYRLSPAVR